MTLLRALILSNGVVLDGESTSQLKVSLDTKVKAKMGRLKTPKVGLGVSCEGIMATFPAAGKKPGTAATSGVKCKVDVRFKIWNWYVG
ncbi:hypothetical protein K1719_038834 [Acacia pycnantha]|nr:hypothetical protein K1719_038834 [Acacia pycnantha]